MFEVFVDSENCKKWGNLRAADWLHFYYDYCRTHKTLRVTELAALRIRASARLM